MRTKTIAIALVLAAGSLVAGCGERKEKVNAKGEQEVDLALDFYVNPDHAGIYQALENGRFSEAGLDVKPRVPSDPSAPLRQVAAGRADLAISYEPEVLLARDQGLPVVAVAALVAQPLTSLISTGDAGIEDVTDLRGKTIATAGIPYQAAFIEAILDKEGLEPDDVETVEVGFNLLPAVLSGQGRRDARRLPQRRRRRPRAAGGGSEGGPGRRDRDPDLRRAGRRRQRGDGRERSRDDPALPDGARAGDPRRRRRPEGRDRDDPRARATASSRS